MLKRFGSGPPLVLIPGIQGRWEWMRPAVRALADHCAVYTFSLGDVRGPALFEEWSRLVDQVSETHASQVAIVGVSFGGLVATYYAALRPERVHRLVLASTPSPSWGLDDRSARYVERPRLSLPLFAARGAVRMHHEVRAALPALRARIGFAARHVGRALQYPASPVHMASCVHAWRATDFGSLCQRITAPTLLITGERDLDRVVPVESSLEYLSLLQNATHVTLPRTGHLGLVLRPREFSALVTDFVRNDDGAVGAAPAVGRATHSARESIGSGRASRSAS